MKRLRMILDVAMTVLMPLLMAYSLIGETFHEIVCLFFSFGSN